MHHMHIHLCHFMLTQYSFRKYTHVKWQNERTHGSVISNRLNTFLLRNKSASEFFWGVLCHGKFITEALPSIHVRVMRHLQLVHIFSFLAPKDWCAWEGQLYVNMWTIKINCTNCFNHQSIFCSLWSPIIVGLFLLHWWRPNVWNAF